MAGRSQVFSDADDDIGPLDPAAPAGTPQNGAAPAPADDQLSPVDILGGGTPQVGPKPVIPDTEFEFVNPDDEQAPAAAAPQTEPQPADAEPQDQDGNRPRQGRRWAERQRRKEGRERTFAENRQLKADIARLADENRQFREQMQRLGPQVQQLSEAQARNAIVHVESQLADATRAYEQADAAFFEALTAGDNERARLMKRQSDEAFVKKYQYQQAAQELKARVGSAAPADRRPDTDGAPAPYSQQAPQAPAPQQPQPLSPQARVLMNEFMQENPWFGQPGSEMDTQMLRAIDNAVASEGFDPSTDDYWDEVADRARVYLPHRYQDQEPAPDTRQPQRRQATPARQPAARAAAPAQAPARRGPPAAAPGNAPAPAGKVQVRLTDARKEALEQAGIIDGYGKILQPDKLKRIAVQYANEDRANGAGR